MKNDNRVFIGLILIIVVIALVVCFFAFKKEEIEEVKSDAIKIKEEYSILNNQVNENNNKTYPIVELRDDNPFVYKNEDEVLELLKNKTALIYFGFSSCPWCRSMLPVLDEAAKETGIASIAYLDIKNIRDVKELDENDKIVTTIEGTSNYYKILDVLKKELDDYVLTTKSGKKINTGEKRLYAPTVVAVRDGKITGIHVGTLDSQKSGYDALTDKEKKELKNSFVDLIHTMNEGICNDAC